MSAPTIEVGRRLEALDRRGRVVGVWNIRGGSMTEEWARACAARHQPTAALRLVITQEVTVVDGAA